MPKVAYSEQEREQIREALIATGLDLMTKQGIMHTTVEQIYKRVGISRTFFYSFFPTKEDLIVESLYLQQPKLVEYALTLRNDPKLSCREGMKQLLYSLCYGEKYGIAVLTTEEQQHICRHLSKESYKVFRDKQFRLFRTILEIFGVYTDIEQLKLLINLSLAIMFTGRAGSNTLPMLIPEAADAAVAFQIEALLDYLEKLKQ